MKKLKVKITTLAASLFCFCMSLSAQEITEENYLKLDSLLWIQYESDTQMLSEEFGKYPEKKDSLMNVANNIKEPHSNYLLLQGKIFCFYTAD